MIMPCSSMTRLVFPASRHRSLKLRVVVDTLVAAFADPPWTRDLPD